MASTPETPKTLVRLNREVCCHSCPMLLDAFMQYICYARGTVPTLVGSILRESGGVSPGKENESKLDKAQRVFASSFNKLQSQLTDAFRSKNVGKISCVAVGMGQSSLSLKEIYRLSLPEETKEHRDCKEPLSRKEIHRLSSSLFTQNIGFDDASHSQSVAPKKMSVYLQASRDADLPGFIPREDFRIPRTDEALRRKIRVCDIGIYSTVYENDCFIAGEEDFIWYASETIVTGFSL